MKQINEESILKIINDTQEKIGGKCLVISVDLDGVLCNGEAWHEGECDIEPNKNIIELVNKLAFSHFVIIHTARRRELMVETYNWLEKHNVRYHAIHFEKMPADIYLDDKAIRI